jgi:hypothetical protein
MKSKQETKMKLKTLAEICMFSLGLTACNRSYIIEASEVKTETAIVKEKEITEPYVYSIVMDTSNTTVYRTVSKKTYFDGTIDFQKEGTLPANVDFKVGDTVLIRYRELNKLNYIDADNDGIKELLSKKLINYHLIDVIKK